LVFQRRQNSSRSFEKLLTFEPSWHGCQTYGCLFEPGPARRTGGGGRDAKTSGTIQSANPNHQETQMAQKVIDVVGTSKESFAKAAENAVAEAAKTVRGMKWARVAELEMELDGKKIVKYRTTTKIYFDIEK
jgi:flavin-binding protein dodecin